MAAKYEIYVTFWKMEIFSKPFFKTYNIHFARLTENHRKVYEFERCITSFETTKNSEIANI